MNSPDLREIQPDFQPPHVDILRNGATDVFAKSIGRIPKMPDSQVVAYLEIIRSSDSFSTLKEGEEATAHEAIAQLTMQMVPMVFYHAWRYSMATGSTFDDCAQSGFEVVVRSLKSPPDFEKGPITRDTLVAWVGWKIRAGIGRYANHDEQPGAIRSYDMLDKIQKLQKMNPTQSEQEAAMGLGVPVTEYREVLKAIISGQIPRSLHTEVYSDDSDSSTDNAALLLLEVIADGELVEDIVEAKQAKERFDLAIGSLSPEAQLIVREHFFREKTYEQIAKEHPSVGKLWDVGRQLKKALKQMKAYMHEHGYASSDEFAMDLVV